MRTSRRWRKKLWNGSALISVSKPWNLRTQKREYLRVSIAGLCVLEGVETMLAAGNRNELVHNTGLLERGMKADCTLIRCGRVSVPVNGDHRRQAGPHIGDGETRVVKAALSGWPPIHFTA